MAQYRARSAVVVDAVQFTGANATDVTAVLGATYVVLVVGETQWVVKDAAGTVTVLDPAAFTAQYEPA